MSRNVIFTSAVVALASSFALFADPKIQPDPVGPPDLTAAKATKQVVQAKTERAVEGRSNKADRQGQSKTCDHAMASCIAIANQEEVALGELGSKKGQNEDVKAFAQMLAQDHQAFLEKLRQFAPEASAAGFLRNDTREVNAKAPRAQVTQAAADDATKEEVKIEKTAATEESEDKDSDTKEATTKETTTKQSTTVKESNGADRDAADNGARQLQIEREVAQQCLAQATEKLSSESDEKFDRCFIGMQIAMHQGMKARLTVYQRHASSELSQVLAAGLQKTEEHLAKAEDIMKSLEQDSSTSSKKVIRQKTKTTTRTEAKEEDGDDKKE